MVCFLRRKLPLYKCSLNVLVFLVSVFFILGLCFEACLVWPGARLSVLSRYKGEPPNDTSVLLDFAEQPNPSSVYRISVDAEYLPWHIQHWDRSATSWNSRIKCPHPYEDHPHLINETKDNFVCLVSPHYEWQHADGCIEDARKIQDFTAPKWLNKKCVTIGHCME
eukprot:Selendium_serpulae@DN2288_c0_g1_i1.p1